MAMVASARGDHCRVFESGMIDVDRPLADHGQLTIIPYSGRIDDTDILALPVFNGKTEFPIGEPMF